MLKLSMVEEVEEYKVSCADCIAEADTSKNALYWKARYDECEMLLTLFKEMKMSWYDWARMKQIANLNREERELYKGGNINGIRLFKVIR